MQGAVIGVFGAVIDQPKSNNTGLLSIGNSIAIAIDRVSVGCGDDFPESIAVVITGLDVGGSWCGISGGGFCESGICGLRC